MKKNKAIDLAVKYLDQKRRSLAALPRLRRGIQASVTRLQRVIPARYRFSFGIRAQARMEELEQAIALLQSLKDVRAQRSDKEDPA